MEKPLPEPARALDVVSCWVHRAREEFESSHEMEILRRLGVTHNYVGIAHCILGYSDEAAPKTAQRKSGRIIRV